MSLENKPLIYIHLWNHHSEIEKRIKLSIVSKASYEVGMGSSPSGTSSSLVQFLIQS